MRTTWIGLSLTCFLAHAAAVTVTAAETNPDAVKHSRWETFERLDFSVNGRACLLVLPQTAAPGKPWIWRTEFFGHEPQGDLALLGKGFHVAYMDVQNLYGAPSALEDMDQFYTYLTNLHGLSRQTALEGFSRGGLFAFNWAARHPERVASIYVDAPVCDFKSWPAGWGRGQGSPSDWERCKQVYGLTDEAARAYKLNPVDNLAPLAAHRIPILSVCGDADEVVPMGENTRLVEERYTKLGGPITVIVKPGVGHHPHSLKDPARIVDFILAAAKTSELEANTRKPPKGAQTVQPRAARSVHWGWPAPDGEIFCTSMIVDRSEPGSYFMACGWSSGYFGIQELGDGRKVILFSVWDPARGDDPNQVQASERVQCLFNDPEMRIRRFGGEGTGGQCMGTFDW